MRPLLTLVENNNAVWSEEQLATYRRIARHRQRILMRKGRRPRPLDAEQPSALLARVEVNGD